MGCTNHIKSVDELLHDEQQREGSEYCEMIKYCSNKELAVPVRVTTKLLEQAMEEAVAQGKGNKFLIDALPRKKDQAIKFEKLIVPARSRIYCISNKNDTVFEN